MKVRELIDELKLMNGNLEVYVASDEEWNTVRAKIDIALIEGTSGPVVISGMDGSEVEIDEEVEE